MLTSDPTLAATLAGTTSTAAWLAAIKTALGASRRVICTHNDVEFRNCALTGAMTDNGTAPSGLANFTPYYVVNKAGMNFQLAATPGGTPLTIAADGSGGALFTASNAPDTGAMEDVGTPGSMAGALAAVNIGKAAGGTISQATIDDIEYRMSPVNFAPNPKNRIASSI